MRTYATEQDYRDWSGEPTVSVTLRQLADASLEVEQALAGVVYAIDSQGLPTDEKVAEAIMEATCATISYWRETGDTSGSGAPRPQSASIGGASYTMPAGAGVGGGSSTALPHRAAKILRSSGLLPTVHVYG